MSIGTMPHALAMVRPYGLGAFNAITMEHARAIAAAAERAELPVVLQLSENTVDYHGGLRPIAQALLAIAEASTAPIVVHLDHATRSELIDEALSLGFTSVMYDGSQFDDTTNASRTQAVVSKCHGFGVWVEAELGAIGGKRDPHAAGVRTDPAEAARFVADTEVDALAVAVGSPHAMTTRNAILDTELISTLAARVPIPLVLHGSSGVPDDGLLAAVEAGIAKVNIATHLNIDMTRTIREVLEQDPAAVDPRRYLGPARETMTAEIARLLVLLAHDGADRDALAWE